MNIPSVKCDVDSADPTDHNRQTCADHVDHIDPTHAKYPDCLLYTSDAADE